MKAITAAILTLAIGGALALKAEAAPAVTDIAARANVTVRNVETVDTAREGWITATAVNDAGKIVYRPLVAFTLANGATVRHVGPTMVKPGEAYAIKARIPGARGLYNGMDNDTLAELSHAEELK